MNYKKFTKKLETSTLVKWRLFNKLREEFESINFLDYKQYQESLQRIPNLLVAEWKKVKREFKGNPNFDAQSQKGFLYEALFYYACLKTEAVFKDAEILGVKEEGKGSPWFEATPLYDVIPPLHHVHEKKKGKVIKNPQTRCDFLVTYVDDEGPLPPALVDVKSKKPKRDYIKKFVWQIISALRRGFIFQFAYPENGIEYPKSLKEWAIMTFCPKCRELSKSYRECDQCGEPIFPFTGVDSYYKAKEMQNR